MPTYDYQCEANGQVFEVRHGMNDVLTTWAELCEHTGMEQGNTPADSPVKKLATGGQIVKSNNMGSTPPCGGGGCGGGMCGL